MINTPYPLDQYSRDIVRHNLIKDAQHRAVIEVAEQTRCLECRTGDHRACTATPAECLCWCHDYTGKGTTRAGWRDAALDDEH